MNTTLEPAPTPRVTWRAVSPTPPPQDRMIKIVANIVDSDDWSTSVEPYDGLAIWSHGALDWLDERGMSIRAFYESELVILEWREVDERRFILHWKRTPPVSELRTQRGAPVLALPMSAWHTKGPDAEFRRFLQEASDSDLVRLDDLQDQAKDSFMGSKSGGGGRYFQHDAWMRTVDQMDRVSAALQREMMMRFRALVQRRNANLAKGRAKKARTER